jgi:phage terminase Nu1 subunit (DNA packaging protein)
MQVDLSARASQTEFAALVGVSQPAISALIAEGKLPFDAPLGELLCAYCERLREQAAGRSLELSTARAELAREMRDGHKIKNAVARGEYAAITLLAEVLATASQAVAERFDHLPGLLKKACPQLGDAERDQVIAVIADARNEWVRETAELVSAKVNAGGADDDEQAAA